MKCKLSLFFVLLVFSLNSSLYAQNENYEEFSVVVFRTLGEGSISDNAMVSLIGLVLTSNVPNYTRFLQQLLDNNSQMRNLLVNGATANALLSDNRFISDLRTICQQSYIAYAVDRAYKVVFLSNIDSQKRGIDYFDSWAQSRFNNESMSRSDIDRINILYSRLISAYNEGRVRINITDYFPLSIGNSWTYTNSTGRLNEIHTVRNSLPDQNDKRNMLYLVEHNTAGVGTTATMYRIRDNWVDIVTTRNVLNQYRENIPPFPILTLADQEWRYNDRGDDLRLKTSKASCNVDTTVYNDCILVEERIVNGNRTLRTKKSYYARGIGLVLVTLQSGNEAESIYMKLLNYSFN